MRLASVGWLTGEGSGEERRGLGRDGGDSWAYVEEVQLVRCAADAGGEEEEVTLQPCYWEGGEFEAGAWSAHF